MANARATVGRLGTRLLARVEWIDERPAARLAHSIRERHWPATHPTRPRLMPQADSARAEPTRMERDGDAGAGTPARPPGMSAFAARWLFGDGEVEGTPFAGGAAVPAERAGQIPSFLVARKPSAADPEPTPPPRATKPRRGRLVEGQPVRISALPPMTTPELPDTPTPPEPTGAAIARDDAPGDAHVPATPGPSTVARDPRPEPDTPEEGGTHAAQPRPQAPRPAPAPVRLRAVPNLVAAPPRLEPVRIARRLEPEARAEQGSGAVVAGAPPEGPAPAAPSPLRAALNRVATAVRRRPATGHVRHETASTGAVPRASATPTPVPPLESDAAPPVSPQTRAVLPSSAQTPETIGPATVEPPIAVHGLARPLLHVRTPALEDTKQPRLPSASAGHRIARATESPLARELGGALQTIEFSAPRPAPVALMPAPLVSRVPAAQAIDAASAAPQPDSEAASGSGPAGGGSHAGASPDADDLYEHMLERLRRDLLFERERMGDLLGDLP